MSLALAITAQQAMIGGSAPRAFSVTVPSGTVGEDLTAFPVYVPLAEMPPSFWADVEPDGSNIRVYNASDVLIPFDLATINFTLQTGALFVRTALAAASATTFTIRLDGNGLLANNNANGRNAVWADYEVVTLLGFDPADRTGKNELRVSGDSSFAKSALVNTFSADPHQGGTFDGTHHYVVDTNAIYKFDASWTLVATNSDPIGDSGLPTVNHLGDPCVREGKLYIPLEFYTTGSSSDQHIAVYDTSDLSFDTAYDVSAVGKEVSGICFCTRDNLFYVTDYITDTVQKYNTAFVHQGAFTFAVANAPTKMQGIEWFKGAFWIVDDELDEVMRVNYNGTGIRNLPPSSTPNGLFGVAVTGNLEGIWAVGDKLYVLSDPTSANSFVTSYEDFNEDLFAGSGYSITTAAPPQISCAELTSWTMAASGKITSKTQNRALISYYDRVGGSGANDRCTIAYRLSGASIAQWDDTNTWMMPSTAFDPGTSDYFRAAVTYQGSAKRELFINGTSRASQAPITARTGFSDLLIGADDADLNEVWQGEIGFAYLRSGVLSANWLAAEYLNLNAPGTFLDIAEL